MARPSISDELVDLTLAVWQPYTNRPLTRDDAEQIITNVAGFFEVLLRWDKAARQQESLVESTEPTRDASPRDGEQ